jgi:outer membrane protein OmpA-like peptidoglycan-associated protein
MNMNSRVIGKVFVIIIALISAISMFSCAGREFAPRKPYMYWYYPKVLAQADRDLEKLHGTCPKLYEKEKARVDRAFEEYAACQTPDIKVKKCKALSLNIHFPFDRPKVAGNKKFPNDDPETWFDNPDAINPKDSLDPCKKGLNEPLEDNLTLLKKAAEFVKDNPGAHIKVTGHTDCIAPANNPNYNKGLSDRRAHAVAAYLKKTLGVKNISWEGMGSEEPYPGCEQLKRGKCDPNACECRAKNRRVEIRVSPMR